ncbi:hypothetical protein F4813DRAFT_387409 [Daldinia decipiens]|uniref:uncharacterized protein n=1 Tax=Daldinia decipiens TaxID=326647 RepID=UPI0020C3F224|nr:uncharacterized protein F4813DRAFT_387409 [Daldinia decipiens]KAI1659918.1 hypothetical protein F4813DRAFT_387409 [Daldinia decipiens]
MSSRTTLGKLNDLKKSIDDVKSDLRRTANDQHIEILNSVKKARNENTLFHTQSAQQAIADHSLVYQGLGDLRDSMKNITTGLQHIQVRQSETLESLAHVKVENSTFFATVTQQIPLASDSSTLVHALRPLLEQYKDEILAGVKKEYRSAARTEFDNIIQNTPAALNEMQHRSGTAQHDSERVVVGSKETTEMDSYTSESHTTPFEDPKPLLPKRQALGRPDKNSITMLYYNWREWQTRLGTLVFIIRDRVHFNEYGRPIKMYELTVHFTPSPSWLSTGFSMTYENKTDARGGPEFGLSFKTYRVLPDDHEVIRAIENGDVCTVRNMLSQKLVSPSDRNLDGWPLLMYAVVSGELDICLLEFAIYSMVIPGVFDPPKRFKNVLEDWVSVCQFMDVDFNVSNLTFLELVVERFWDKPSDPSETVEDLILKFNSVVQQRIGLADSADPMDSLSIGNSSISCEPSPILSVPYRRYFLHPSVALGIKFLAYVMLKKIAECPDCIFDKYEDITISDWFYDKDCLQDIWEDILEDRGFDVDWVYEENGRRKRVVLGESSTHDINIGPDTSRILDVRRRQGYENSDE